jgi:predicted transposase/invertase (TIGR01784 family)
MNTRNIHDAFARETLSYRENAVSFFRGILPEEVVNRLDFETLTEENTSYTDEDLSAYFSDVVYHCSYRGSPLKLVLLLEHKSFVPEFPHRQILRYMLNIWERAAKQHTAFPVVLPIILYHGRRKWKRRPFHSYLSGDTGLLARYIPGFEYLLVDLSTIPERMLKRLFAHNPAVRLWLLVQKYIHEEHELLKRLNSFFGLDIVYFSLEAELRFVESMWRYIFEATEIDPDTVLRKLTMLPEGAKEALMTTAEKLRKQGKQEGIHEGKLEGKREGKLESARKMREKGYSIEDICDITGLSRKEVEGLR